MKTILILSLVLGFNLINAQQLIESNINLRVDRESFYGQRITSYFDADSSLLLSLGNAYINEIFSKDIKDLRNLYQQNHQYNEDDYYELFYILSEKKNEKKDIIKLKQDSIFINDELYMTKNGEFHFSYDSSVVYDEIGNASYSVKLNSLNTKNNFAGISFLEKWNYDKDKSIFNKNISFIQAFYSFIMNYERQRLAMFKFKIENNLGKNKKLIAEDVIYDQIIMPYYQEDWRDIKTNNDYLPRNERNEIIINILKDLKNKNIKAYPIDYSKDSVIGEIDFSNSLKFKEVVDKMIDKNDTISTDKLSNVYGFRFYENWYFDWQTFSIEKKVKGIAFIIAFKILNPELNEYDKYEETKIYFDLNN